MGILGNGHLRANGHFGIDELWGKWALGKNRQFGANRYFEHWGHGGTGTNRHLGQMGTLHRWALGQVGTNGHQKKRHKQVGTWGI